MCEETKNYLWALQDVLGHGATSQVYKAYNKSTAEVVAAKVYQVGPSSRSNHGQHQHNIRERDYRPILDREMDILRTANHGNIVQYIALEAVVPSEGGSSGGNREALLLEYCNGGSLSTVLERPENRFGLREDEFLLVFRHLTNAIKYLHDKNTIHRDIKPDNIMLSINLNGERTYKLADLGVARLICEGEQSFTSLVGTEEYIHPDLYQVAVPDNKSNTTRSGVQARAEFPFEFDLWSLGVTLYQCATGELPFQPYAGTRKDRTEMRRILSSKPNGCISGVQNTPGGEIEWTKSLPNSCRLSPSLKRHLEPLLQRLLESNRTKLMTFNTFFAEVDRILNLIPIYYLNLKQFKLCCSYFEPTQSINTLFDELHRQNNDKINEDYYCSFQNVPYPISKTKATSIKKFCEQLPIPTTYDNRLVFYTFSSIIDEHELSLSLDVPTVRSIRQYNDVAATCDWSKDIVGVFFHVKSQIVDYQHILQTAQCSTTIMQQHLKAKLLEFLCTVRERLIDFRAIDELRNIVDQLEISANAQMLLLNNPSDNSSIADGFAPRAQPTSGETPGIGFSHLISNMQPSHDNVSSPKTTRHQSAAAPMKAIQKSVRDCFSSYQGSYEQLKKCESDIINMIQKDFGGQINITNDQEPYANTLWSSDRTRTYASWIQRVDKFLNDVNDLNETFKKDRLLNSYNRLQADSHFRRRANLEELFKKYVAFATDECYPNLLKMFYDYNEWIEQRSQIIKEFQRIQNSYEKQCQDIIDSVGLIETLRTVIYKNIHGPAGTSSLQNMNESVLSFPGSASSEGNRQTTVFGNHSQSTSLVDEENKAFLAKIRGTTKKSIEHAEESINKLEGVIKQLRLSMKKK